MSLGRLSGFAGCIYIDGTHSGDFDVITPQASMTFTTLTGLDQDGNAVNFLVTLNIGANAIEAGQVITIPAGQKITSIVVAGGTGLAYTRV